MRAPAKGREATSRSALKAEIQMEAGSKYGNSVGYSYEIFNASFLIKKTQNIMGTMLPFLIRNYLRNSQIFLE